MTPPLKLVIDTNVFVESIPRTSPYHSIFTALLDGAVQAFISNDILFEYEEVLTRKLGQQALAIFLAFVETSPHVIYVDPTYHAHLIVSDPDDNKFVDCAICAGADYIVTKDRHYDDLMRTRAPQARVIHPDSLVEMISGAAPGQ